MVTDSNLRDALAPKKRRKGKGKASAKPRGPGLLRRLFRTVVVLAVLVPVAYLVALRWVAPPTTPYILMEERRLGAAQHVWVPLGAIAPAMQRAAVAA